MDTKAREIAGAETLQRFHLISRSSGKGMFEHLILFRLRENKWLVMKMGTALTQAEAFVGKTRCRCSSRLRQQGSCPGYPHGCPLSELPRFHRSAQPESWLCKFVEHRCHVMCDGIV